jgi:hypothetical protein
MKKWLIGGVLVSFVAIVGTYAFFYLNDQELDNQLSSVNSLISVSVSKDTYNQKMVSTIADIDNYVRHNRWRLSNAKLYKLTLIKLDLVGVDSIWSEQFDDMCNNPNFQHISLDPARSYCLTTAKEVFESNKVPFPKAELWSTLVSDTMTVLSARIDEFINNKPEKIPDSLIPPPSPPLDMPKPNSGMPVQGSWDLYSGNDGKLLGNFTSEAICNYAKVVGANIANKEFDDNQVVLDIDTDTVDGDESKFLADSSKNDKYMSDMTAYKNGTCKKQ